MRIPRTRDCAARCKMCWRRATPRCRARALARPATRRSVRSFRRSSFALARRFRSPRGCSALLLQAVIAQRSLQLVALAQCFLRHAGGLARQDRAALDRAVARTAAVLARARRDGAALAALAERRGCECDRYGQEQEADHGCFLAARYDPELDEASASQQ